MQHLLNERDGGMLFCTHFLVELKRTFIGAYSRMRRPMGLPVELRDLCQNVMSLLLLMICAHSGGVVSGYRQFSGSWRLRTSSLARERLRRHGTTTDIEHIMHRAFLYFSTCFKRTLVLHYLIKNSPLRLI
jgi:hypothetical protein